MLQLHGMKVISLTAGGLTDVWTFFFGSMANNRREKSAEAILDADTSLRVMQTVSRKPYEASKGRTLSKWVLKDYLMEGRKQNISSDNFLRDERTASGVYEGVQTYIGITDNTLTEVKRKVSSQIKNRRIPNGTYGGVRGRNGK